MMSSLLCAQSAWLTSQLSEDTDEEAANKENISMTAKKTVAKKTAKSSTAGNAKRKVERLEKDLKEAGKKTTNKKCALHKKPIPLHIEQE